MSVKMHKAIIGEKYDEKINYLHH